MDPLLEVIIKNTLYINFIDYLLKILQQEGESMNVQEIEDCLHLLVGD